MFPWKIRSFEWFRHPLFRLMVLHSLVKINLLFRIMDPLKRKSPMNTYLVLRSFCFWMTSWAFGCSTCSSCLASWLTTATFEALAFISCSKLSKRCFMIASSSMSSVIIMVDRSLSWKTRKSLMSQCMKFPTMWYVRPAKPAYAQSDQSLCLSFEYS